MYPIESVPQRLLPVFYLNPMTPIVVAYRDILYYAKAPALETLFHALGLGFIFVVIGLLIFGRLKRGFEEEL
jgi:ABC-2 type transport system permease protein